LSFDEFKFFYQESNFRSNRPGAAAMPMDDIAT